MSSATGCSDNREASSASAAATPVCSLARALAIARPGFDVMLRPGRYGPLTIAPSAPASHDVRFIAARGRGRPVVGGGFVTGADGLALVGLSFSKKILIQTSRHLTVSGVDFAGAQLWLRQSSDAVIQGCRFHDFHPSLDRALLIMGNQYRPDQPNTRRVTVRNNVFRHLDHDAIAVYNNFEGVLIEGNKIERVIQPPDYLYHTDAIQVMGGRHLTIRKNLIRDGNQGILIKDGSAARDVTIADNVIHDEAAFGIQVFDGVRMRIFRNTVWRTPYGVFLWNDPRYRGDTATTFDDNVVDRINLFDGARITHAGNNVFRTYHPLGRPAFLGRPNFVDAEAGDFSISRRRPGLGISKRDIPGAQAADANATAITP